MGFNCWRKLKSGIVDLAVFLNIHVKSLLLEVVTGIRPKFPKKTRLALEGQYRSTESTMTLTHDVFVDCSSPFLTPFRAE